ELSQYISDDKVMKTISLLNNTQYEMRKTNLPRVFIELAVFEMANILSENKEPIAQEITNVDETKETVYNDDIIEPTIVEQEHENTEEKFIDVRLIENILNNASKEKKLSIIMQWDGIRNTDINYANIEQILLDGQVEAVSTDNKMIISYEIESICASLYDIEVYDQAIYILQKALKERFEIIPLPRRIWDKLRDEYVEQYRKKIRYPKLTPINEPIIIKKPKDKYEFEPDYVKEAIDIFGEDIVKIK
ncbi:MAG TPA: hypothetical protein VIK84_00315, partial [Haloplasmataceae bacterium]